MAFSEAGPKTLPFRGWVIAAAPLPRTLFDVQDSRILTPWFEAPAEWNATLVLFGGDLDFSKSVPQS